MLIISVAARLAGMHPQTLRQYDRLGLVSPGRTPGGGRRYSERDVVLLREIQRLSQDDGVSLAGIRRIIELERLVVDLQRRIMDLEADLADAHQRLAAGAVDGARTGRGISRPRLPAEHRAGRVAAAPLARFLIAVLPASAP